MNVMPLAQVQVALVIPVEPKRANQVGIPPYQIQTNGRDATIG